MKTTVLAIALAAFSMLAPVAARAELKAGVAGRDVTPDKMMPVSAGGPGEMATQKKGTLDVRALVLENNGVRIAIVSEPFLGFPCALGNKIRAKVTGIPASNIMIGATHTHGAPDPYGFPNLKTMGFGCDMEYLNGVCDKSAEAINEAISKLQPAKLKITSGEAKGKIAYNYYAPQLYDPRCNVIQAIGADGKAFATLVNYAIHPEILIGKQTLTPDLIGPLYDRIAEKGGGMAVFMNSAQGGMITADCRGPDGHDINTWGECIRIGSLLGDEALRIAAAAEPVENPVLYCAAKEVKFPLPTNPMWKIMAKSPVGTKLNDDNTISVQMNLVNLGSAQMLTIPGEALPNIGYYLKRKMHGKHNFLLGLTNDAYGYILTKVDFNSFARYKYCSETSLGEMTGEILIEEGLKLADVSPRPAE